jgi:hypothetical protein
MSATLSGVTGWDFVGEAWLEARATQGDATALFGGYADL